MKKSCKQDKKDWIESKCTEAQEATSRNDIRLLYGVVRQLTCTKDNTNVPIMAKDGRCLLLTESEQNLRWKEHFEEVLNQPKLLSTPDFGDTVMADCLEVYEGNINLEEVQRAGSNLMIVSLASTEFENGSGVNECANTDNMSNVHCEFTRLCTRLTYCVRTLGVRYVACISVLACGILSLSLGIWWHADFVIFALFSGVYLNLLNY